MADPRSQLAAPLGKMTPELRTALLDAYEAERENWGGDYVDRVSLKNLADVKDGDMLYYPSDLLMEKVKWDEEKLDADVYIGLGTEYFGLGTLPEGWDQPRGGSDE